MSDVCLVYGIPITTQTLIKISNKCWRPTREDIINKEIGVIFSGEKLFCQDIEKTLDNIGEKNKKRKSYLTKIPKDIIDLIKKEVKNISTYYFIVREENLYNDGIEEYAGYFSDKYAQIMSNGYCCNVDYESPYIIGWSEWKGNGVWWRGEASCETTMIPKVEMKKVKKILEEYSKKIGLKLEPKLLLTPEDCSYCT